MIRITPQKCSSLSPCNCSAFSANIYYGPRCAELESCCYKPHPSLVSTTSTIETASCTRSEGRPKGRGRAARAMTAVASAVCPARFGCAWALEGITGADPGPIGGRSKAPVRVPSLCGARVARGCALLAVEGARVRELRDPGRGLADVRAPAHVLLRPRGVLGLGHSHLDRGVCGALRLPGAAIPLRCGDPMRCGAAAAPLRRQCGAAAAPLRGSPGLRSPGDRPPGIHRGGTASGPQMDPDRPQADPKRAQRDDVARASEDARTPKACAQSCLSARRWSAASCRAAFGHASPQQADGDGRSAPGGRPQHKRTASASRPRILR